jgi:hypothetical protein
MLLIAAQPMDRRPQLACAAGMLAAADSEPRGDVGQLEVSLGAEFVEAIIGIVFIGHIGKGFRIDDAVNSAQRAKERPIEFTINFALAFHHDGESAASRRAGHGGSAGDRAGTPAAVPTAG